MKGLLGSSTTADGQPITTEIFANEAYFDSKESVGTFSGAVIVKDPRFSLQADKLTVYLGKGETRGLDRAVAEGNVAVVRDAAVVPEGAPAPAEGDVQSALGRSRRARRLYGEGWECGTERLAAGVKRLEYSRRDQPGDGHDY